MKLIIAGASGYVATEIIRQSLSIPQITSVIALARRPVPTPSNLRSGADESKLHSVVLENYDVYPDEVKAQFEGADACIWTVAITPRKAWGLSFDEVRRVCHDYTFNGLDAMLAARNNEKHPFRFLYMSGAGSERDQSKKPAIEARYLLLRGETETQILAFAAEHKGKVEISIAKPGFVTAGEYVKTALSMVFNVVFRLPRIDVRECSAAMLREVIEGFSKDTLENEDLVGIGRQELKKAGV